MLPFALLDGAASLLKSGLELFQGDDKQKAELYLKELEMAHESAMAQAAITKQEASSSSLFVSGWRPAAGWICVAGIASAYIVEPYIFPFLYEAYPALLKAPTASNNLIELFFGLVGITGLRSFEKTKGVARS